MWIPSGLRNGKVRSKHQALCRFRPRLEELESRSMLAALTVSTPLDIADPDDGVLSLREAVLQANATIEADTVVLPAGTYLLDGGGELEVTDHVTITGAGADATVIDGGGAHRVFHLGAQQVTISGVTIQGGEAGLDYGGGIRAEGGTLAILNSTVSGNRAGNGGGIAAFPGSTLTLDHCTVSGNSGYEAGGIYSQGSTLMTNHSAITGNFGTGIMATDNFAVTVNNSTISGNSTDAMGGGLLVVADGTLTVDHSTISGNSALNGGGGIWASANVALSVRHSAITGNSTDWEGGGIYAESMSVTLDHSTISGNSALNGGGLFASYVTLTVMHSNLSGNSAVGVGGGIFAHTIFGTMTIDHSTITGNSAAEQGGGIIVVSATLAIDHSTISGNTALVGGGLYASLSTVEIDQSTLNDLDGGGIWNEFSTIHLKQTEVDDIFYKDQDLL